ncbi:MAG TPA: YqeG family HAD IIIA-type phosphatase [Fimbriimonadaceae bacterium]|nr:YqeG family HAD IIIA-type phosphatase [Fimbriimonadaceae bacterium]
MSGFQPGLFDRNEVGSFLRPFCPIQAVDTIGDVDLAALHKRGKRLLLVDVDNTLVIWRSHDIPDSTRTWIEQAKSLGMDVCIISNTRNRERLQRLAGELKIDFLLGRFKPSRKMFLQALAKFSVKPEQAVMVGDQLFTDVFGANRSGIEAIWVRQMAPVDLAATKISRFGERVLRRRLYKALQRTAAAATPDDVDEDLPVGGTAAFELLQIPIVRQFIKFCVVGGTSTVIDVGLHWFLMFGLHLGDRTLSQVFGSWLLSNFGAVFSFASSPENAALPFLKVISASVAIVNSFIWNRRWTFKIRGREHRAVQFQKFVAVALIGLLLNTVITTFFANVIPGHPKRSWAVATVISTVLVAVWNFSGQKLWTFRQKH